MRKARDPASTFILSSECFAPAPPISVSQDSSRSLVPDAPEKRDQVRAARALVLRGQLRPRLRLRLRLRAAAHTPRLADDVQRRNPDVRVAEALHRHHRGIVRRREPRTDPALLRGRGDEVAHGARARLEVAEERAVVPRHVRLHAREERRLLRLRGRRQHPARDVRVRVPVDPEEYVERVDDGALAGARAGELFGLRQARGLGALEDPPAAALSAEPRADFGEEHFGVAALPQVCQDGGHRVDDIGELREILRDATKRQEVADEGLVQRRAEERERRYSDKFNSRRAEVEYFLRRGPGKCSLCAEVRGIDG